MPCFFWGAARGGARRFKPHPPPPPPLVSSSVYVPAIYVINKIDQITLEELNVMQRLPHYCPVCAYHEWNLDGLVEMVRGGGWVGGWACGWVAAFVHSVLRACAFCGNPRMRKHAYLRVYNISFIIYLRGRCPN